MHMSLTSKLVRERTLREEEMGNCQAVDTAALVIQHPATGKSEKLFWPIPARHIMKSNPGHYVALLITTTTTTTAATAAVAGGGGGGGKAGDKSTVRITRVKLLKPTDTLTLGHVYRLISTQEVMKGLVAKKQAKMMKMKQADGNGVAEKALTQRLESKSDKAGDGVPQKSSQVRKLGTERQRSLSKAWQPSLKSISEAQS